MGMKNSKKDKHQVITVFITGATGGLGKAFAVECASRGWDLFLTDKSDASLDSLASGLRNSYGVKVITAPCDLTNTGMRNLLFDQIRSASMLFTILINVAGIDFEGLFSNQTSQQVLTIARLNIEATLSITHTLLSYRNQQHTFRIINVSSLAAFYPMPVKAIYAATKRFLLDFSLALREELRNQNATVTVLCPAGMPTNQICINSIEAQGWVGKATTMDVGRVANQTLNSALAGKAIIIPGLVNRVIRILGMLIPSSLVVRLIGWRWASVHQLSNSSLQH
jgi:short-subunit dehydrogenase